MSAFFIRTALSGTSRSAFPDPALRRAIDDLLSAKRTGDELDRGPRIPALSDFIEHELPHLEETASGRPSAAPPAEVLDDLFRATLDKVWTQ